MYLIVLHYKVMDQTENLQRIAQYLYESLLKDMCRLNSEPDSYPSLYHTKYYSSQNDKSYN